MTVTAQAGVFLTVDDATYLADALDRVCATMLPAPRLAYLTGQLRKSCHSLAPTQAKDLRGLASRPDPRHHATYDLVDVKEAARILGCTPSNVRDLIARGRLAAHRAGRSWLLPARTVVEYAEQRDTRGGR